MNNELPPPTVANVDVFPIVNVKIDIRSVGISFQHLRDGILQGQIQDILTRYITELESEEKALNTKFNIELKTK